MFLPEGKRWRIQFFNLLRKGTKVIPGMNVLLGSWMFLLLDARDRNCPDLFTVGVSTQTVPPVEQHTLKLKLLLLLTLFFWQAVFPSERQAPVHATCFRCFSGTCEKWLFQQTSFYISFEQVSGFHITSRFPVLDSISCSWGSACRLSTQQTVFFTYNTFTDSFLFCKSAPRSPCFYPVCFFSAMASECCCFCMQHETFFFFAAWRA